MGVHRRFVLPALVCALAFKTAVATVYDIPNSLAQGDVYAEYTSGCGSLDGPKVFPRPNATSYDWWYFDAVSTSSANESITIVFYESSDTGFITPYPPLLAVEISGTFADGTAFDVGISALNNTVNSAVIETSSDGIVGNWQSTGFTFASTDGFDHYVVSGANPEYNITGSMTLDSLAPAHYPCGPDVQGTSELICPGVGWSNAVPDAVAAINFTINGVPLSFTGVGYHDKNWGDVPFVEAVSSWYWGHAHLGPYSLVWFDAVSADTHEYVAGYVARDGQIIESSCSSGSVKVRPYGVNSDYPPQPTTGDPTGFTIEYDLGEAGMLVANVTTQLDVVNAEVYIRYMGPIEGGIVGEEQYTGMGLWEQFKF